ncbi:hypothetical protein V1477_014057 [Vespula maculifrons]|uniref:Uncharacterized protein n=1 Tax=Vespula maculifrons TaxID=7453 RepID=A0ABD2BMQ0_VESMC
MLLGYVQNDLNIKSDLVKHSDTVLPFRGIRNGGIPFVGWSSVGQFLVQAVARQLNETNRGNTTAAFQCENSPWRFSVLKMEFPRIYSKERSVRLSSTSVARARLNSDITSLDFAYSVTLNARWSKGLCVT